MFGSFALFAHVLVPAGLQVLVQVLLLYLFPVPVQVQYELSTLPSTKSAVRLSSYSLHGCE